MGLETGGFLLNLISGGIAGTTVDVALFPIDTIKTRLQSPNGFIKTGGFRGIYNGIGAVGLGSAPSAALFFTVYEHLKPITNIFVMSNNLSPHLGHMLAASVGECAACLVRVPTELVKSKMQTNPDKFSTVTSTIKSVVTESSSSSFLSLYRGFSITIMREIPFSFIQFPIYERLKVIIKDSHGSAASPLQSAFCGSVGGAIAAAATTPLDVVKTRLMLGADKHGVKYLSAWDVARRVASSEGYWTFFNGVQVSERMRASHQTLNTNPLNFIKNAQPRVMWITIGGFVFFGAYEGAKDALSR